MIEIVTFRLNDQAAEAAFIAADRRVQTEFLYHQPGLIRRTTARGEDGDWIVMVHWHSGADADAAATLAASEAATLEFDALLDATTVTRRRYETLD